MNETKVQELIDYITENKELIYRLWGEEQMVDTEDLLNKIEELRKISDNK